MAKQKSSELIMARVATVIAVVFLGAFLGWQFSHKQVEQKQDDKAILATMPRFSRYADTRSHDDTVLEVTTQVQGQRTGIYNLLLEVVDYKGDAIYGEYRKGELTSFPHGYQFSLPFKALKEVMASRYKLGDRHFCQPVHLRLHMTALGTDLPYDEKVNWRAGVDMCNFGDTFIPPQDKQPEHAVE